MSGDRQRGNVPPQAKKNDDTVEMIPINRAFKIGILSLLMDRVKLKMLQRKMRDPALEACYDGEDLQITMAFMKAVRPGGFMCDLSSVKCIPIICFALVFPCSVSTRLSSQGSAPPQAPKNDDTVEMVPINRAVKIGILSLLMDRVNLNRLERKMRDPALEAFHDGEDMQITMAFVKAVQPGGFMCGRSLPR
ncbi:unnamed protein product [Notodromas monacha]|uniref:Uncharacterized protein n=1 Tax=Notodromas monacha TaxID=399045 RepID=A0A7R9G9H0_9CRUS|nr:unnamed protein product [Notodromas monacha]CAG0912607.1 unnamed protein product [Notodromas monacha]